jgi:hypothetical protein
LQLLSEYNQMTTNYHNKEENHSNLERKQFICVNLRVSFKSMCGRVTAVFSTCQRFFGGLILETARGENQKNERFWPKMTVTRSLT